MGFRKALASSALLLSLNLLFFTTLSSAMCPVDTLMLGTCVNLLGSLVSVVIGSPSTILCCSLIDGLADLELAACLCTLIRANILGIINLNVTVTSSTMLNNCGSGRNNSASNYTCP